MTERKPMIELTPVQVKARFVIELYSDGRVNINHPTDRVQAYGLLGIAHEILVAQNVDKSGKGQIVTPILIPPKMKG